MLQPQCVIELQLKCHYIHLPRMVREDDICLQSGSGSDSRILNYFDHYAEGILFKKSKKAMSALSTTADRERESKDWKERWVVLQGNRLMIYHKRKVLYFHAHHDAKVSFISCLLTKPVFLLTGHDQESD